MTKLRNASKEHALGVVGVVLGIAMLALGNLIPSLSFMADGGNVVATFSFIMSLANGLKKSGARTANELDAKVDQRLAGQTEVLVERLTNNGLDNTASIRKLEATRDSHAARLDAHDAKHAAHEATQADHGDVLDDHGEHIKVISDGLRRVADKCEVEYQPRGVLKTRARPA